MSSAFRVPSRVDALFAGCVAVVAVTEVAANDAIAPKAAAWATELALALALLGMSQMPLLVIVAVAALQVAEAAAGVPLQQPVVPLLASVLAVYALVVRASHRQALGGMTVLVAALGVETLVQHKGLANFAFGLVFAAAAFAVARTVAHRTRHATELAVRAEQLERNSELGARQAVAQERTRLARELHDVIAHSVSVMVVQAGGAERVLTRDPAAASAALRAIQTTGRQALSEMTRLVGILRDADEEIGLAPQPGLADLPALVEQSRAAGIRIDLRAEGDPRPLAPGVELAVYRVAQEALTNIRKHASSAHATVRIKYAAAEISVEIRNSPADASTTGGPGEGGHGLVGMRERVAIYDGHLDAGPLPDGGFRVSARIPAEAQP